MWKMHGRLHGRLSSTLKYEQLTFDSIGYPHRPVHKLLIQLALLYVVLNQLNGDKEA